MSRIVLATTSRYKRALFEKLGLPFTTAAPPFEEVIDPEEEPRQLAINLAVGKARSLSDRFPDATIIGADQILAHRGTMLTKPGTVDKTLEQLLRLRGSTHQLHTAFAIHQPRQNRLITGCDTSTLSMHDHLSKTFLKQMVMEDETWDCVGGYKYESKGIFLFKAIAAEDPNAIVGLPLLSLVRELQTLGFFPGRFEPGST